MSDAPLVFKEFSSSRKVMCFVIDAGLLSEICRQGWAIPDSLLLRIENTNGVPKDAVYLRGAYDSLRDVFVMMFEHPSFDDVKEGDEIPEIRATFRSIYLSGDRHE